MVWFPHAKINLGLQVLRKREDGFHDISTCMVPVGWNDILEIVEADKFEFTSSGLSIPDDGQDNLCKKAYDLIASEHALPPVHIYLHKIIPMGAGLGGGSSDAAFMLKGLNELFDLGLTQKKLHEYAARLGSDCPFFLYEGPMIAEGRGERLSATQVDNIKDKFIVLVYPGEHIGTAEAYSLLKPKANRDSLQELLNQPLTNWKNTLSNDFESAVFALKPKIKKVKEQLYQSGALYASMTGSGSAVFGLFEEIPEGLKFKDFPFYKGQLS